MTHPAQSASALPRPGGFAAKEIEWLAMERWAA